MNIVLADDERLPRLGLKSMIEELYPEQHSFIEVTNGEELLVYVTDHTPDVIFLDIHMPKLSGLDAFAEFHTKDIPVVMLTGYAEFAYAQKALTYGAVEYLLKPAALEDIRKVMEKIMARKQKELALYQKDYELECKKILDLYFSIQFIQQPKYVQPPYTVMVFYFDHDPKSSKKNNFDLLSSSLAALSETHSFPCGCSFLPSGEFIYITSGQLPRTLIRPVPEDFQKLSSCLATGFVYYADSIEELLRRIRDVQHLESIRLCTSLGKCIFLDELKSQEVLLPLSSLLDKAILALQLQDSVTLHKALADLRNLKHGDALLSQCDTSLARVFELTFHRSIAPSSITQLADSIQQLYNSDNAPDIIEKINLYVDENYMNQIGINTISDLLGISPNYLSKTYKLKTGENFTDYLTTVRMQKALEMVAAGRCRTVRELSESVGYFSTRYFTKLFMKATGVTPSEYLKQHLPL